ncbi:MAG: LLM class flavin-dependent oxidoreductase [Verrucomicrobia bacterium]|nr:LLM class flavin-dependent oxidoreductase [Verrucomicrobiota bacterium]
MTSELQKAYWLRRLSGLATPVTLPIHRERPPVPAFLRQSVARTVPSHVHDQLRRQSADPAVTPAILLLAALNAVLHRYTGADDISLGTVLDHAGPPDRSNLVVLRMAVSGEQSAEELARQISVALAEAKANAEYPLSDIREALALERGDADVPLFLIAVDFLQANVASGGEGDRNHRAAGFDDELARCDVVIRLRQEGGGAAWECDYDAELFDASTIEHFLGHIEVLLTGMATQPGRSVAALPMLTIVEQQRVLVEWNNTRADFPQDAGIPSAFEAQVERTPDAVAVIFRNQRLTYRQLNARANQLAHRLRQLGIGPDALVGISVERSLELVIGLLGILKSGGAYVPLDPGYPRERLAFMLQDSQARVLLTQQRVLPDLPQSAAAVLCLDGAAAGLQDEPQANLLPTAAPDHLAYVIYTSGSTGRPKGVMVCHRNVMNFFAAMDRVIGGDGPGVWLAVTSISFDISVLELLWTLARGFTVVICQDDFRRPDPAAATVRAAKKKIAFSLLYFASATARDAANRYRLLLEGAKFADQHGFEAVWTPERHFHAFGGLYPNPSVTSAAVATVTERVHLRAGSVVLPLQHPVRVAEEWSVVDNLSRGRAGISFASGWQINDFVLAPQNYAARKEVMLRDVETVRRLWRGETLALPGVDGQPVSVKIWPPPVQPELPIWLTATGNPETCRLAGELGANLLTHLVGQRIEDLAEKIQLYRTAWRQRGHAGEGRVTLMLHTFVGPDLDAVRETVREPFTNYLRTSVDLLKHSPWGFATARLAAGAQVKKLSAAPTNLSEEEMSALLAHAFEGYFKSSSLFGTPEICLQMVERLRESGVDEIACLIDFGVDAQVVLDNLRFLDEVRQRSNEETDEAQADFSLAALAARYGATHFQCTPSLAAMLAAQPENHAWLGRLRRLLIGGEAFPVALANQLKQQVRGTIHNMYGPTETTVWSATEPLGDINGVVPIGRPIANTQIYLLDAHLQPVPVGVPGELYIGGAGVVRGYLNRPELTAEKFLLDPLRPVAGARLYRTGDLARYRNDGSLQFLGRMDHQVKIRGHRVELAEIESVLGQHASVRQCAVVVREDTPGTQRLIAYVVPRPGALRDAKMLRAFLQASLPEYMLPGAFVFLDRLPQTPNGKIDRRALPVPQLAPVAESDRFLAPRTAAELAVAEIWTELLGLHRVGAEDNFFELGGHSLLAMQLVSRIHDRFQVNLPLKNLFERPTVAGLAEAIEALAWTDRSTAPVVGTREEVVL